MSTKILGTISRIWARSNGKPIVMLVFAESQVLGPSGVSGLLPTQFHSQMRDFRVGTKKFAPTPSVLSKDHFPNQRNIPVGGRFSKSTIAIHTSVWGKILSTLWILSGNYLCLSVIP